MNVLLLAALAVATNAAPVSAVPGLSACAATNAPAIAKDATAEQIIRSCRTMVPSDVELRGRLVLRNRKGIVQSEYGYVLVRRGGVTDLALTDEAGAAVPFEKGGRLLKTDVTWSDLTLDYLWWDDFSFDPAGESESVHGQTCAVLLLKKEARTVKVWVDRKTGALMQAEELRGEKTVRRLWGTRIRKFGDRWMANVMEVETVGSGHRTKITVEDLR